MSITKKIRTALRQFDGKRREKSIGLEVWFLKLLGGQKGRSSTLLKPAEVKRVLIIRNNKRIGNMFFLLPFVNQVKSLYPSAEVELILSDPWQGSIFENLGLSQIHFSQFGLRTIPAFFSSIKALRKKPYDLILLPYGGSSDRIVASMIESKNVVAFYGRADAAVCSHTFKYQGRYSHFALSCMELLEQLHDAEPSDYYARLVLSDVEQQQARDQLVELIGEDNSKPCLAYFRGARGAKVIADQDWQTLLDKFKQHYGNQVNVIEILSPDVVKPLTDADFTYSNGDLRKLAAFLQQVPLFFCGDTGPLHLASSAGAHCVGLFTVTNIAQYGCLGEHAVNLSDLAAINAAELLAELGLE
ncbi:glycosyltransferase family 9 protein [Agarivorans sp. 1_MG-2023]|uniref:glycosyltransferase family 9 protein n=1 Tax=Agarivorans sp. 1_MG-2023 TaxID=3062634 RepID=UPI0026E30A38|nr:glycosyltransferase family 9 protein [Agarivorans sp. 1_MG-2023]MDO6764323.1 glycosyltransferase family 9 protein [Agarivorans sp. 1_MG-2023]